MAFSVEAELRAQVKSLKTQNLELRTKLLQLRAQNRELRAVVYANRHCLLVTPAGPVDRLLAQEAP